jgi:very-short-patch-repair endonuclease
MQVTLANELRAERRGGSSPVSIAEVQLLVALDAIGLYPDLQFPVGRYDLDFFFADVCLCVEVDGSQHLETPLRDATRDTVLREQGIDTLRITASAVFADADACAAQVAHVGRHRRHGNVEALRTTLLAEADRVADRFGPRGELYRSRLRAHAEEWVATWEREHVNELDCALVT